MDAAVARAGRGLPRRFSSKRGEPIQLDLLGETLHEALLAMYLAYQPRNSFQGLPPVKDSVCTQWVRGMIRDGVNLVAVSAPATIVGHTALFPVNAQKCEMLVVVSPGFQDTGIGTELVRACVQLAVELDYERMWLPVAANNLRARHVYKKCGFEYVDGKQGRELDMALDLVKLRAPAESPSTAAAQQPYAPGWHVPLMQVSAGDVEQMG